MAKHKPSRRPAHPPRSPLTHFLCVQLVTAASRPQLEKSLRVFKEDVVDVEEGGSARSGVRSMQTWASRIHPRAIRPIGSLHCTLGVMSLKKDDLEKAIELLQRLDVDQLLRAATPSLSNASQATTDSNAQLDDQSLPSLSRPISPPRSKNRKQEPLVVDLKGLVSMHAPEKTSILYTAPYDPSGRLFPFCQALQCCFQEAGFLIDDKRPLKLHATIVNTIYAKGKRRVRGSKMPSPTEPGGDGSNSTGTNRPLEGSGHGPNADAPLKIDATAILDKYKDFVWAQDVVLEKVSICEMGAKKMFAGDGSVLGEEYTEVAHLALPR